VTEHDHTVVGVDSSPVGRDIGGMQRLGLDPGLAQQPGAVVRGVPAGANPDQSNGAPGQPVGRSLGRSLVSEQAGEFDRLRNHGLAHPRHGATLFLRSRTSTSASPLGSPRLSVVVQAGPVAVLATQVDAMSVQRTLCTTAAT
jgi:hypothetical protein